VHSASSDPPVADAQILLVDDNRLGLIARKDVLEELGYHTTTVSSPVEALDLFSAGTFDLVITDYKMPEMNGRDFIVLVRKTRPDVPIVLISGFVDVLGLTEVNTGADAVIMKSHNEVASLVRTVARLLRKRLQKKPPSGESPPGRAKRAGL
jgi:CheY-like chemotaxis protein